MPIESCPLKVVWCGCLYLIQTDTIWGVRVRVVMGFILITRLGDNLQQGAIHSVTVRGQLMPGDHSRRYQPTCVQVVQMNSVRFTL